MLDELRPVFATLAPSALRMELRAWSPSAWTCRRASPSGPWRRVALHRPRDPPPRRAAADHAYRAPRSDRVARAPSGRFSPSASSSPSRARRRSRSWTPPTLHQRRAAPGGSAPARASHQSWSGSARRGPRAGGAAGRAGGEAGRESPRPGMLESQRMQLELARLDRRIRAARAQGSGEVSDLARRRAEVKRAFEQAYERALAETGGSDAPRIRLSPYVRALARVKLRGARDRVPC